MEIGIYITANIIYLVRELYLGDRIGSFSLLERWVVATLFYERHFPVFLTTSGKCEANKLFIYRASSRTRYSRLLSACWSWRCNSGRIDKGLRNALRIEHFMWRVKASLWSEFRSQKRRRLSPWRSKDWDGLHESSYCYLALHIHLPAS